LEPPVELVFLFTDDFGLLIVPPCFELDVPDLLLFLEVAPDE